MITNIIPITLSLVNQDVLSANYQQQEQWLSELGAILLGWSNIEDYSIMTQGEILYKVWKIWEAAHNSQGSSLSLKSTSKWDNDFYKWAKQFTKRRGKEPATNTIDNKITIYRDYIAEKMIECPQYVEIQGQTIEVTDEVLKQTDYSKMLVARGTARKGEMTPQAWSVLFDNSKSVIDLKNELDQVQYTPQSDFRIFEDNGIIYGYENGERAAVLQTLFENSMSPLFFKTLSYVLRSVGLKVPLDYQEK